MASTLASARVERSVLARYGWPVGIAAVLLLSAGSNIAVMLVAQRDPAFAVEPEYYKKAIEWDASMAQERANAVLQWRASARLVTAPTDGALGSIVVDVTDANGQPLTKASVSVEAMHNARASDRIRAALRETIPGTYTASIPAHRPGEWEVRLVIEQGAQRFTTSLRVDGRPSTSP